MKLYQSIIKATLGAQGEEGVSVAKPRAHRRTRSATTWCKDNGLVSRRPVALRILSGWGGYPEQRCAVFRPEHTADTTLPLTEKGTTCIARGCGKSYGDATLNPEGVVSTERLNRFLTFDKKKGTLSAQAGVTLAEIIDIITPHGWFLPVVPGTRYVSLGGCIASNIHGKNHYLKGDFGKHLRSMVLRLPGNRRILCSPRKEKNIFWATLGGMGMTGIIEEATIKLLPLPSLHLSVTTQTAPSLEAMVKLFRGHIPKASYAVGWINHYATNHHLGQGIFHSASHCPVTAGGQPVSRYTPIPSRPLLRYIPAFLLNRLSSRIYNALYYFRHRWLPVPSLQHIIAFFFPLDRIPCWNRWYGKQGMVQYHCILPDSAAIASHLAGILHSLQEKKCFSFLTVLKYHGNASGMLGFSMKGFSLAMDFPYHPRLLPVLQALDHQVITLGGRVYLAKDATLSAKAFHAMYAHALPAWRRILKKIDPHSKMRSLMAKRLHFREE